MNPRRQSRLVYSQIPLAARALTRRESYCRGPTHFQSAPASTICPCPVSTSSLKSTCRKCATPSTKPTAKPRTRFDFKDTNATIEFGEKELTLSASTEDRLRALYQLLEEKLVKRSVSLKSLDPGKIEEASQGAARQKVALKAGISQDVGKQINKMVKDMGVKNLTPGRPWSARRSRGAAHRPMPMQARAAKGENRLFENWHAPCFILSEPLVSGARLEPARHDRRLLGHRRRHGSSQRARYVARRHCQCGRGQRGRFALLAQAKSERTLTPRRGRPRPARAGCTSLPMPHGCKPCKNIGDMLGLSSAALADPAARAQVMAMRDDPHASAMMAAGLAGDNQVALTNALGRQPDASELYLAHFLGADGAGRFLTALAANPAQSAASINPKAAASNQSIFYDSSGQPRSLQQVMDLFRGRMASAMRDEGGVDPSSYINVANYTPINGPLPRPIRQRWAGRSPGNSLPRVTAILPVPVAGPVGAGSGAGTDNAPTSPVHGRCDPEHSCGGNTGSAPASIREDYFGLNRCGCNGQTVLGVSSPALCAARRYPHADRADGGADRRPLLDIFFVFNIALSVAVLMAAINAGARSISPPFRRCCCSRRCYGWR